MTSQNGEDTCQQRNCIDPTLGLAGLADRDSAFIVMKFQGACNYKIHHACYLMHYTLQSAYKKFINAFTCEHLPTLPHPPSFPPSQILIHTAELTGAPMERTKLPNHRNGSKGDSRARLIASPAFYR